MLLAWPAQAAPRRVVLLQSFDRGNLSLDRFTAVLRIQMQGRPDPVTFTEFVVSPEGFDGVPEEAAIDYLRAAFEGRPTPDLVITTGGVAAAFAQKYRTQVFPHTPILYAAVDQRFMKGRDFTDRETAVTVANDPAGLVADIRQLFPATENVFVVIGTGMLGRFWRSEVESESVDGVRLIWPDGLSYSALLQHVATLPPRTAIYYHSFDVDTEGATYPTQRVLADLRERSNVPIFGGQGSDLGSGIVGGNLMSIDDLARETADVALRVFSGTSPALIKTPPRQPGPRIYDWRELQRFGVSENRLPAGSVIRFREPGVWDRFRWVIIGSASALVAQAVLIVGLVVQRGRRRRTENALRLSYEENQDLAGRLINAQEDERARIARDLHDDLSQQLAGVAIILSGLKRAINKQGAEPDVDQRFVTLQERTVAAATAIRNLSHELHPGVLEHAGLTATLRSHCADIEAHHQVTVAFSPADGLDSLDSNVALCLFRVVQEALANAVRHARARTIGVSFLMTADDVELNVADDGVGFVASERARSGLGLRSIHERVRFMRGTVVIDSRPGEGASVRVRIPVGTAHTAPVRQARPGR